MSILIDNGVAPAIELEDGVAPKNHLKLFPAAHPLLQIVMPRPGVFYYGHHDVVVLGEEDVCLGDEDLHLGGLGAGLVEPLLEVVEVEGNEIHRCLAYDPDDLALLHLECGTTTVLAGWNNVIH